VQTDLEILRQFCDVRSLFFGSWIDVPRLLYHIAGVDLVFCWFAWNQAFWGAKISRLLGKPCIIISGGFEVVAIHEIGYGGLIRPRSGRRVRLSFKMATEILAISNSVRRDIVRLSGRTDVRMVPLGFEPAKHPFSDDKELLAITVGSVTDSNLQRKGILLFLEAAKGLPNVQFAVIGAIDASLKEKLQSRLSPNVTLTGRVGNEELASWMRRAKVYVQLSAHEGFGSAVAEAMLAGCVPVVTSRGALPEVVGNEGLVVPWGDPDVARESISRALQSPVEASYRCRERITTEFSLDNRRRALFEVVQHALG